MKNAVQTLRTFECDSLRSATRERGKVYPFKEGSCRGQSFFLQLSYEFSDLLRKGGMSMGKGVPGHLAWSIPKEGKKKKGKIAETSNVTLAMRSARLRWEP